MKRSCFVFLISVLFAAAANAQTAVGRTSNRTHRVVRRAETQKPLQAPASAGRVNVRVVWNKIFGLPPAYPGASEAYASPCGLFVISVHTVREEVRSSASGTFAVERADGFERYVCSYILEALPKNERLAVIATFPDSRDLETAPWISVRSSEGAMPGIGQERVLNGARVITLTDQVAIASVAFRVQYETPRQLNEIY